MPTPTPSPTFEVVQRSGTSEARAGILRTPHGTVSTPCFMPIATVGAVHHVSAPELRALGADMLLANTYHLVLRPGAEEVAARGGIQRFMGWNGPLLTDSGGFQVFSLGARERRGGVSFVAMDDEGVTFRSHLDGSRHRFTPELAIDFQRSIGSDIAMVLDVCPPQPCAPDILDDAVRRTVGWAQRSIAHAERTGFRGHALLFGIVQGGTDVERRRASAAAMVRLPFDGFAIGGVAVGESTAAMRATVTATAALLPEDRPRYLMGVGTPADIVHAVSQGIDCFDCVLPTRDARHGRIYRRISGTSFELVPSLQGLSPNAIPAARSGVRDGSAFGDRPLHGAQAWYETLNIGNERWKEVDQPIDPACPCPTCAHHTLAYLHHLFAIREPLGARLLTLHNLSFYLTLMQRLRASVRS